MRNKIGTKQGCSSENNSRNIPAFGVNHQILLYCAYKRPSCSYKYAYGISRKTYNVSDIG